ncbi:MAG: DUF3750 domain-containing protein [Planctomycetes bacterium]|nr:DUF3750 domain-containing protein [Planctomycetota bacterium]
MRLLGWAEGEAAERAIAQMTAAMPELAKKYEGGYTRWPGPNSNTFVHELMLHCDDIGFVFDPNSLGKDVPGLSGDLLVDAAGERVLVRPHIDTEHRHGSGCTASAAITARLAHGDELAAAVEFARDYLVRAQASAPGLGGTGPVNHWA